MKKIFALPIAAMLMVGVLSGCGTTPADPAATPAPAADPAAPAAAGALKTGLGLFTMRTGTNAAADSEGRVEVNSTIVGVLVDDAGKIVDCKIDVAQTRVGFDAAGAITADLTAPQQTKDEKKDGYGMAGASAIGKEWYQQAEAFAQFCIGKTADEVKNAASTTNDEGGVVLTDLTTSCTIGVEDFQIAVANAVANAQSFGANAGDKLSIGTVTVLTSSKPATAEAEGLAQVDSTYAVTTFDASNKVTSCIIDSSQAKTNIDTAGVVTSDLTAPVLSKDELKGDYGMLKASPIGKEWFEQASAFADFAKGKTAAEIAGAATTTNEEGGQVITDLTSSCTISVGDFQGAITKADAAL